MTKRDYVLIAKAIADAKHIKAQEKGGEYARGVITTAERIADALEVDNFRFDRARFLTACGV